MKKIILLSIFLVFFTKNYAQENIVSLITTGTDSNNDKAVNKALRNAIEQAFGSFLVSKSTLVNEQLASDEIQTVASGNIVSYEIVSTISKPDNKEVTATVNAKVSLVKLKSFIESKGISVDFKGKLFAQNIMIQEFYEQNESKALKELYSLMREFNNKSFNYVVEAKEPTKNNDNWNIQLVASAYVNDNFYNLKNNFLNTLKNISLSPQQAEEYMKLGKYVPKVVLGEEGSNYRIIYLRNEASVNIILDIIYNFSNQLASFEIDNSVNKITLLNSQTWELLQDNFLPILNNKEKRELMVAGNLRLREIVLPSKSLFSLPKMDEFGEINFKKSASYKENYFSKSDLQVFYFNGDDLSNFSRNNNFDFLNTLAGTIENSGKGFPVPGSMSSFGDKRRIGKGGYDLIISFKKICDNNKLAAQFNLVDFKSLDDIKKIDQYKIYPKSN